MIMEYRLARLVTELTSLAQRIDTWKLQIGQYRARTDAALEKGSPDIETLSALQHTLRSVSSEIALFRQLLQRHSDIADVQHGQISGFAFALEHLKADCNDVIANQARGARKATDLA
jgi:hypothetical protein